MDVMEMVSQARDAVTVRKAKPRTKRAEARHG